MKVVVRYPPNFAEIAKVLPAAWAPHVYFCYGGIIFNPSGQELSEAILAHEAVHCHQQGDDPDEWWSRYMIDMQFRFRQELEAHREEYRVATRAITSSKQRRFILVQIAERLAGPLYGYATKLATAIALVKEPPRVKQ